MPKANTDKGQQFLDELQQLQEKYGIYIRPATHKNYNYVKLPNKEEEQLVPIEIISFVSYNSKYKGEPRMVVGSSTDDIPKRDISVTEEDYGKTVEIDYYGDTTSEY